MRKFLKIAVFILASLVVLVALLGAFIYFQKASRSKSNYAQLGAEASTLIHDGITFRDLNKNGKLDPYENPHASLEVRVDDLVSQMTLEEKAGSMFIMMIGMTHEGDILDFPIFSGDLMSMAMPFLLPSGAEMLVEKHMNSFNTLNSYDAATMAVFNNNIQKIAERSRLGIPITLASDPRHGISDNLGIAVKTPAFSTWPTALGLAATRDTALVKEFGEIARQEYRSIGITLSLGPMADLGTEPRWTRLTGTFGEDAMISAAMTKAYVLGFQGDTLGTQSVACMTKHFSGGGPQENGMDAHFASGKNQAYPGDNFNYHLIPFTEGAFRANTAQVMPYYGVPIDQTEENVGFAFNKSIITKLLRDSLKFEGVICSDWGLITDKSFKPPAAWGVENLSEIERAKKIIEAGCDMLGGEISSEWIIELVETNRLDEDRIDHSVKRIMKDKFRLGLFDNPYVDINAASEIAGRDDFREKGKRAQAKSLVLLKNEQLLPLKNGVKFYVSDVNDANAWKKYGIRVDQPEEADVIIKKIKTPHSPPQGSMVEKLFRQGRLNYSEEELDDILGDLEGIPSVIVANLERATILTEVNETADALIVEFGVEDDVLADVLFGQRKPTGKLPVELPSSMEAVEKQYEDVPYDSENPLYEYGYGLTY